MGGAGLVVANVPHWDCEEHCPQSCVQMSSRKSAKKSLKRVKESKNKMVEFLGRFEATMQY